MGYRTKLDYSSNRQISQREKTDTSLSGATIFGLPFSGLSVGPDIPTSGVTDSYSDVISTFSGNSTTSVFNWFDSRMQLGYNSVSAITPSTSAITQEIGYIYTGNSYTIIDGNISFLNYSGTFFTLTANYVIDLGGGNYSGTVKHDEVIFLSASSIDYSGRTIWIDNPEITRTNRLIIGRNPQIDYVWTCIDSEGMGAWLPNSSGGTANVWTAGTNVSSAVLSGSNSTASGQYAVAQGYQTLASGFASHAEGRYTIASGDYSHVEGYGDGDGYSTASGIASHAEGFQTTASGDSSHAEGASTTAGGISSHAEGNYTTASGQYSHVEGSYTISSGNQAHAEGFGSIASGDKSHAEGQNTIASGITSHAEGNYTTASGTNSHAEGNYTLASGANSHAEGSSTTAFGSYSHAEGDNTNASGSYSHAEGTYTTALGDGSHAGGSSSSVNSDYSFIHSFNSNIYTNSNYSAILGGDSNTVINSAYSSIIGGELNTISGHTHSFIGGGYNNLISCDANYNAIIGGQNNLNHASNGVIIGGTNNSLGSDPLCPSKADNSVIIGGSLNFIASTTNNTHQSIIIGGFNNRIDSTSGAVDNTVILGGTNITATTSNMVYTPNLIINTGGTSSSLGINTNNSQYIIDAYGSTNNRFYYDGVTSGGQIAVSATTGLPRISVISNSASTASAGQTASISFGVRAWDDITYPIYGKQGDGFIYAGIHTNGLNIISNDGSGGSGDDYIRFYAGQSTGSNDGSNIADIHIQGSGSTKGHIGIGINVPTEKLDISGNTRIRGIGASASAGALHYTSDGVLTTNTSDERLKTNITTLTNALDKIKQLRGVSYNWTEEPNGDVRIGLIAQEVNNVIPELTFVNKNSEEKYMGVHYDNIVALLIEAIKELSNGSINNDYLETQTILAEDNNIELNYNGTHQTALDGGITIKHGIDIDNDVYFKINSDGDFTTNVNLIPKGIVIPEYTPVSSSDSYGVIGNFTRDDNYLYIKTLNGWKRTNLENF